MNASHSFLGRFGSIFRLLTFASLLPAIPMCLTHGVLSDDAVPAAGLVPLLISGVAGIFLHRESKQAEKSAANTQNQGSGIDEAIEDGLHEVETLRGKLTHPFFVFAFDVLLAGAILVVLIYTWKTSSDSAMLGMLAAYATIPLMMSFVSHTLLALAALWHGLAIHGMSKWLAWKAVDSHCPQCNHSLRPEAPELPWVKLFNTTRRPGLSVPLFTDGPVSLRDETIESEITHPIPRICSPNPEPIPVRPKRESKVRPMATIENATEATPLLA